MYVKLFRSILNSTVWMMPNHTVRVWITVLLLADSEGYLRISIPGLAKEARVSIDECRESIAALEAPDPDSQSKEEDGRRIIRLDEEEPVWHIVNYQKYRSIRDDEQRKEYMREYMKEYRQRKHLLTPVNSGKQQLAQEEAEEEKTKESPAALAGDGRDLVLVPPPPKQERTRKARPQRDMADSDKVIAAFRDGYKKRTGGIAQIAQARDRKLANTIIDQQGLDLAISYAYEFGYNPPRDNRDKGFCDFMFLPRAISKIQDRRKECGL